MADRKNNENFLKNIVHLRKRALDVKFDLDLEEYQPLENIGIGAYGVVCSAIHKKSNDRVAIKKIGNVFDVKDISKRTYREIKILKHFKHDNIIHIREILKPKETLNDFRDVYVVFDLMESDLHRIIYSKQELTEEHVRYFLYQILRGLKYIHSAHVIHRDLKPSNLLVNEDCHLRIGDFGMARGISSCPVEPNYFMTQYVATRWYRAPEIMLSLIEYGAAVDMWSVGCIFAEMLGRKHLFPGKDSISQIKLIIGIVGTPDDNLLQLCHSPIIKNFFTEMGKKEPVAWQKLYPKASKKAINFLGRMLQLHPKKRITVEEALVHPFLNKYHDPDDEPICVPTFNFDFEKEDLSVQQLRGCIHKEAMEYHKPRTPTLSFNAFLRPVPKSPDSKPAFEFDDSKPQEMSLLVTEIKRETPSPSQIQTEAVKQSSDTQQTTPTVSVKLETDDLVFKKPLSAKKEDTSQNVDLGNLLRAESIDVEMLSAKSTDGKQSVSAAIKEEKTKENKEPVKLEQNKTISEDTKNLIKAALMNSSFKKRTDSVGDDEKPKHITAAMRQKEREDKRKKKKEKTLERKRKEKKKNAPPKELLTSEDKEMLQRWTKMQKVNVPIAPKPDGDARSDPIHPGVKGQNIAIIMSTSDQVRMSNKFETQVTVKSEPETLEICQRQGKEVQKTEVQSSSTSQMNVQQGTLDLLQKRLLSNSSNSLNKIGEKQVTSTQSAAPEPTDTASTHFSVQTQMDVNRSAERATNPASDGYCVDFSSVPFAELDFLAMVTSPNVGDAKTQDINSGIQAPPSVTSHEQSINEKTHRHSAPGSSEFLQTLCSESSPQEISRRRISEGFMMSDVSASHPASSSHLNVGPPAVPQHKSPEHLPSNYPIPPHKSPEHLPPNYPIPQHKSPEHLPPNYPIPQHKSPEHLSPNYPNHTSPQYFTSHSPESHRSISPNQTASPGFQFQQGQSQNSQQLQPSFIQHPSQPTSIFQNVTSGGLFMSSNKDQTVSQSFMFQNQPVPNFGNQSTRQEMAAPVSQSGQQDFLYRNPSGAQDAHNVHSNSNSNSPPPLLINTQQAQLSFQQIFQEPVAGPSNNTVHVHDTQVDLVALLTKQLSRSNVEDMCPPLALTPRGTGGGYGVGVDLDALMISQDSQAAEPSPLSSSILADWMDVTSHMNIDMDALEQELQSPMALSYNDLNLYSS